MTSPGRPHLTSTRTLSLITAADPSRCQHLEAASDSVQAARTALTSIGWTLEWSVAFDGERCGECLCYADRVAELSKRSGIATARNIALARSSGHWVMPFDSDDLLSPTGLRSILKQLDDWLWKPGWIAANRLLLDGSRTPHWREGQEDFLPGDLASNWTSPFPFHPNTVISRRSLALEVGGWPALPANEDLGWVLALSERELGRFLPEVVVRYRVWNGQEVASAGYRKHKEAAFLFIEAAINAQRASIGRGRVSAPEPGPAYGIQPTVTDSNHGR